MEYDKNNKKRIVLDYHNKEIINYIFDKNKFSLKNLKLQINNKDESECLQILKNKNYEGLQYYGNNNRCIMYNSNNFSKPIDKNLMNNYDVSNYKKIRHIKDFDNIKDQKNINNYFKEINNFNLSYDGLIDKKTTKNKEECLRECNKNKECKNILFFQENKKCKFYNNKDVLNKNSNLLYDTYTLKNNVSDNIVFETKNNEINNDNNNNKNNLNNMNYKYTNCILNKNFNNYNDTFKEYNNICKNNLGTEYVFKNIDDNKNIIKCGNNKSKIRCIHDMFNINTIEKFQNKNNNYYSMVNLLIILIIILLFFNLFINKN